MTRNLQIVIGAELDAQIEAARGSVPRSVWARDIIERYLEMERHQRGLEHARAATGRLTPPAEIWRGDGWT